MRVLLIEDDLDLCELIAFSLRKEGHQVDACHEGDDGLRWMIQRAHDIVLLDRMLPRVDGTTVLARAREQGVHTPVLMITALGSVENRIEGLDLGADDYIVKPFQVDELLARMRAVARRPQAWEDSPLIRYHSLVLDPMKRNLTAGALSVSLSRKEADLLGFFLKNPEKIIPRPVLFAHVWGPDAGVEDGNLDNYIHFIRQRLKAVGSPVELITIRQSGYVLQERQNESV